MQPLVDPETPPLPPCPCRCPSRCPSRCRCRYRSRCRRLLVPVLAALGAAALGAAVAATVTVVLGVSPGGTPPQAATAAHVLLSAGSLVVPPGLGWRYEEGINGVFLSSDVQMTDGKLQVTAGGLYLFYGQFAVTCTASTCPPGTVTLQLQRDAPRHSLLTVPLALPGNTGSHLARSGLAQAIGQLQRGDVLHLELTRNISGDGWQLAQEERESNFVGLLRIAGG